MTATSRIWLLVLAVVTAATGCAASTSPGQRPLAGALVEANGGVAAACDHFHPNGLDGPAVKADNCGDQPEREETAGADGWSGSAGVATPPDAVICTSDPASCEAVVA